MSLASQLHGGIAKTAKFTPTDPNEMLAKLLNGEFDNWDQITQLSDIYRTYMLSNFNDLFGGKFTDILKGGAEGIQQMQKTAKDWQAGIMPPEDVARVFRTAAGQNLASGLLGSPAGAANKLRSYGSSIEETRRLGAQMATEAGNATQRWEQIAQGLTLDPAKQLYSPEWFTTYMAQQAAAKQATKQLQLNQRAQPKAWGQSLASIMNFVGSLYGGKGGYTFSQSPQSPQQNYGGTPTSQYPGAAGTMSNFLGGNLHWGGDTPYLAGGMPSDVSSAGYSIPSYGPGSPGSYNTSPYIWNENAVPYDWGGNPQGG